MNERLTALYRSSRPKEALASQDEYKSANVLLGSEVARFAELIVRECVEQVWYSREDGINGNVSEVIKERIKQHFGVEE
jgi:hypothetical protein